MVRLLHERYQSKWHRQAPHTYARHLIYLSWRFFARSTGWRNFSIFPRIFYFLNFTCWERTSRNSNRTYCVCIWWVSDKSESKGNNSFRIYIRACLQTIYILRILSFCSLHQLTVKLQNIRTASTNSARRRDVFLHTLRWRHVRSNLFLSRCVTLIPSIKYRIESRSFRTSISTTK